MLIGFALLLNWVIQLTRSTFFGWLFYWWRRKFSFLFTCELISSLPCASYEVVWTWYNSIFWFPRRFDKYAGNKIWSFTIFIRFAYGARKSLYCARMHIYDNSVGTSCVTITQNNPFASQSLCDRLWYKALVVSLFMKIHFPSIFRIFCNWNCHTSFTLFLPACPADTVYKTVGKLRPKQNKN